MLAMAHYTTNPLSKHTGIKIDISYDDLISLDDSVLRDLLFKHKALLFKGWLNLTPEQVNKIGKKLGTLWTIPMYNRLRENSSVDSFGDAFTYYTDLSYQRLMSGIPWHADVANEPGIPRYPARILYCTQVPTQYEGMSTDVSNMAAAYNDLTEKEKEFYSTVYFIYQSWQKIGSNIKDLPAIETHPYTKEKFLRLNAVSMKNGWIRRWYQLLPDGSKMFLDNEVLKQVVKEKGNTYQYSHIWEVGDMLIFDNWSTMHRKGDGTVFEGSQGVRSFIRTTIDTHLDTGIL